MTDSTADAERVLASAERLLEGVEPKKLHAEADTNCDAADADVAAEPTAEEMEAAQARAREMLEENPEMREGFRDLQALTLVMGLPATRALLRQMVTRSGIRGAKKGDSLRAIRELSEYNQHGCMQVDFYNLQQGGMDVAYLMVDECPRTHNLDLQLGKIRDLVRPDVFAQIIKHLSALVFTVRTVYAKLVSDQIPLLQTFWGEKADLTPYLNLKVDPANTTLWLVEDWPTRVGIFIRLRSETGELPAAGDEPETEK